MPNSTYMGDPMGFVQGSYVDQMGTALPGDLAYASDYDLVDTGPVKNMPVVANVGTILQVGLAAALVIASGSSRPGAPTYGVTQLSVTGTDPVAIDAVTVRSQVVRTDAGLRSGWYNGDMATFLYGKRVGGRIYVKTVGAATAGSAALVIKSDTTAHGQPIGSFTGVAISGDTVSTTNVRFLTSAPAGGMALIEITA